MKLPQAFKTLQKLNKCTPEERDQVKGDYLAEIDFLGIIKQLKETGKVVKFLEAENSEATLLRSLLDENEPRIEDRVLARIKRFKSLKKQYLKEYGHAQGNS